jgi:hypothetical protein
VPRTDLGPDLRVGRGGVPRRDGALDGLRRGCDFLIARADEPWLGETWPDGMAGIVRARVTGNWLRELDSLLHSFLDEAELARGGTLAADRPSIAKRWHHLPFVRSDDRADRKRLLGLHRSRQTFWLSDGYVRRPDHPAVSWLTAGWPVAGDATLRRFDLGTRLAFDGADLVDTCCFYQRLATALADSRTA